MNFIGSIAYHSLMPCIRNRRQYNFLLFSDVFCCWFGLTGSTLPILHYGFQCSLYFYEWLSSLFYMETVVNLVCIIGAKNNQQRFLILGIHSITRSSLWLSRIIFGGSGLGLFYHLVGLLFLALGGFINTSRIPERFYPGKFDIYLNSHNIWHIMAYFASISELLGCWYDVNQAPGIDYYCIDAL